MKEPDASKQATRRVLRISEMILFSLTQVIFYYQLSQNEMFNFRQTDNKCNISCQIHDSHCSQKQLRYLSINSQIIMQQCLSLFL